MEKIVQFTFFFIAFFVFKYFLCYSRLHVLFIRDKLNTVSCNFALLLVLSPLFSLHGASQKNATKKYCCTADEWIVGCVVWMAYNYMQSIFSFESLKPEAWRKHWNDLLLEKFPSVAGTERYIEVKCFKKVLRHLGVTAFNSFPFNSIQRN